MNFLLCVLLAAVLSACQTREEREPVETRQPEPQQRETEAPDTVQPPPDRAAGAAETEQAAEIATSDRPEQMEQKAAPDEAPEPETGEPEPAHAGGGQTEPKPGMTGQAETENGQAGDQRTENTETAVSQNSDARFREAMRRFDRRLERERFGTAGADRNEAAGGGDGSRAGGPGEDNEDSEPGSPAVAVNPFEDDGDGAEQPPAGSGRGGLGDRNTHSPPPGTPDGSDDDIVARQLREAAESEPDPELRERLWEEYRAYKNDQN